jgi:hypothetical protein
MGACPTSRSRAKGTRGALPAAMQKSTKKPLLLTSETLRQLSTRELVHVDGGGTPPVSGGGHGCGTSTRGI